MEPLGTPALTRYSSMTFHPGPLEALYYCEKMKYGKFSKLNFNKT